MPQPSQTPTILLTGFGPFLTVTENATSTVVPAIALRIAAHYPQLQCVTEILPTDWTQAPARFAALMQQHTPAIALQFGVSPRAKGFVIETRGRNARQASNDASGCKPQAPRISANGPKFLATTLPIKRLITRLHALGLPAVRSHSAGQYVCNALLYQSLGASAVHPVMMGFIHLPVDLPAATTPAKKLSLDGAVTGGVAIAAACHEALAGASDYTVSNRPTA